MKAKDNKELTSWSEIKDKVYGEKGTETRDNLEREAEAFKIGLLLKKARESRHLTQEDLAKIIDKKRTYISRVENDGSNITLSTLFEFVEKGLGGKVRIFHRPLTIDTPFETIRCDKNKIWIASFTSIFAMAIVCYDC